MTSLSYCYAISPISVSENVSTIISLWIKKTRIGVVGHVLTMDGKTGPHSEPAWPAGGDVLSLFPEGRGPNPISFSNHWLGCDSSVGVKHTNCMSKTSTEAYCRNMEEMVITFQA